MSPTLALTALVMGLAGGPHCVAMCGAACGAVVGSPVQAVPVSAIGRGTPPPAMPRMLQFQLGRLAGYALAGAVAGFAVEAFATLSKNTAALKPVWTLFHLSVLAWGLMLLARARQPAWVESAGRSVWAKIRPMAHARGGLVATGALWAFMPCGLLYSALLVASLSGGAFEGALAMALFAIGSGLSLGVAPSVLRRVQAWGNRLRDGSGTRVAGALLALAAVWALWMDLAHRVAQWCATF